MMPPVFKFFTAHQGIHRNTRQDDEYNGHGIFYSGHGGLTERVLGLLRYENLTQ